MCKRASSLSGVNLTGPPLRGTVKRLWVKTPPDREHRRMVSPLGPEDLNRLPLARESTKGFFDYQPLSADAEPPSELTAHHRLARREDGADDEEQAAGRLRLAFVTGYDADADQLDCLAYVWRPESRDAVWALERWEAARSVLRLYTRDASFDPQGIDAIHRRLRGRGDEGVAEEIREVLGGR